MEALINLVDLHHLFDKLLCEISNFLPSPSPYPEMPHNYLVQIYRQLYPTPIININSLKDPLKFHLLAPLPPQPCTEVNYSRNPDLIQLLYEPIYYPDQEGHTIVRYSDRHYVAAKHQTKLVYCFITNQKLLFLTSVYDIFDKVTRDLL